jgi:hemoglobin-like flavoprotein
LARTVERMVHPDPARRFQSFDELLRSLMRYSDDSLSTVELSWRRCLRSGEDIFSKFYGRFFEDARSAEELFEKPWPTERQKNLLRDAVINLLQFYALKQTHREIPASLNPLEGLAQQHAGRNIENSHFPAFARALIDTVIEIDPATDSRPGDDDPIRDAWKAVIEPGALFMETRVADLNKGRSSSRATRPRPRARRSRRGSK